MSEETNTAQIVLYQSEGANVPVEVSYMQGTFWMPQRRIAELFGKDKSTISRHLKNILAQDSALLSGPAAERGAVSEAV